MKNVLIAFLGVLLVWMVFSNVNTKLDNKKAIDSLNTEIKIKQDSIKVFQNKIDIFADKVDIAEKKLEENKNKVKKIYQTYEIQIQTVDSYDVVELEQFFSNRYKDTTSIK